MRVSAPSLSLLKILFAFGNVVIGVVTALFILEVMVHITPLFSFNIIVPASSPLTITSYDVRYSDGDTFRLSPELIKPLAPGADAIEAHIDYQTDEFGFHNDVPLPATADIAVVGRSYSMGPDTVVPWPKRLSIKTGLRVLNLAQIGSGNDIKLHYLQDYGFFRHPRWIVVEVLPRLDILNYQHAPALLLPLITGTMIFNIWFQLHEAMTTAPVPTSENTIYPLSVQINNHPYAVTFSTPDLSSLTVSASTIQQSKQWQLFRNDLSALIADAHAHSSCVAILYAQSKTGAYLPLLQDSTGLTAARQAIQVYSLNSEGFLIWATHKRWT